MKKSSLLIAAAALALTAFSAQAATTPAAPAAAPAAPAAQTPPPPPTFGAAIPGQCVLDVNTAMENSALGKAANTRMNELAGIVKSELDPKGQQLQKDLDALKAAQTAAQAPNATAAVKQAADAKLKTVGPEYDAFQQLGQQRQQELKYTQQSVLNWIFNQMTGPINQVVTARGCATVISSDSLLHVGVPDSTGQTETDFVYANPAMDITAAVTQKLDAANIQLPQIERANLDQQADGSGQ